MALTRIAESLPPRRHKSSTDEVFSEPQRLHKILASCGFGSRRAMEELIIAGRITVNRMPADVGQKVGPGDEVRINGEPVKIRFTEPKPRMLLYHKPTGELVTRDDPEDRPTVFEDLPSIRDGKWIAVGRLDYNTEGLLLFTNSGELANRLMHPRYEVEREYAVRVMGRISDEQIGTLTTGVELEDGPAKCEKVEDAGGEEEGANHWYNVTLKEGRNREVRRLFEALGLTVSRLIRVRYGRIAMPSSLKRGDVYEMEPQDMNALLRSVGMKPNAMGEAPSPDNRPPRNDRPTQGKGQRPGHRGRRGGPGGPPQGNRRNNGQGGDERFAQGQGGARGPHAGQQRGSGASGQRTGPPGQPRRGPPHQKRRYGQGGPGQGSAHAGGQRRPQRDGPPNPSGYGINANAGRPGKPKRRGGRGVKSSSNVSAQVGVARDRRVGQKPKSAEGRAPSMPVVTHKKRRSIVAPDSTPPRDDENE
ncbi:MAG TPA: pseudouridine synthase [Casimicrobiaceae bacterium]|nr:pseudouridine synthase [Casimicrobiaceae bacterium]